MADERQPDKERVDEDAGRAGTLGAGGGGSNDVTSGGGAGAGIPDAETAMRLGEVVTRGDVDRDRERIFPDADEGGRPAKDEARGT